MRVLVTTVFLLCTISAVAQPPALLASKTAELKTAVDAEHKAMLKAGSTPAELTAHALKIHQLIADTRMSLGYDETYVWSFQTGTFVHLPTTGTTRVKPVAPITAPPIK